MSALTTWKPCTLIIHGGEELSRGNTRLFLNLRCLFDSWVRMYAVSQCWHQDTGTLFIFFMVRNQWKGSEEAISSQVPFSPPFFFHIVRGYSSYDPLELHPGGQIQGAGRGDLLILAMQASITQRGRERAIFKPQRHKGGDQLADFWLYIPLQVVKQKFHSVMPASGWDLQVGVNSLMCYWSFYHWITIWDKIAPICLWSQEAPNEHK